MFSFVLYVCRCELLGSLGKDCERSMIEARGRGELEKSPVCLKLKCLSHPTTLLHSSPSS